MPLGTTHELTDLTIIGAGPTGLFALFYAGMRGATARVIDALPELGGQLAALYPEKDIFDVAGFPRILAKDLIKSLAEQAGRFHPNTSKASPYFLNQRVHALEEDGGHFTLVTETDRFPSRSIVIAAGIGAFTPRRLPQPFAEQWYGKGIHDAVTNPEQFRGQRVVILGGGDSAFDWATQLLDKAASVTLVHRSDRFRAHGATVRQLQTAVQEGRAALHTFHDLAGICGDNGHLTGVTLRDSKTKTTREVPADAVLAMLGYHSDIGPLAEWGMRLENHEIVVSSTMETGRPGIYAAGDITTYPGKLKLIATGFSEAAIAVNQAVHWIYPDKKVAPGHSSNMAIFGQTDD
ncbi:MAG TPA: NAD(P)/FAD-dependent oxidoreductase [Gemmatimonadaceae bacterium]|nr:NAD(P)/FAD-dependent oxidoreductase [Gemmatimonadaceae bacterium]